MRYKFVINEALFLDSREHNDAVDKDAVFSVLDELKLAGIKPTVSLVREGFPNAQYSVISAYISEWSTSSLPSVSENIPPPPENISQGFARIWAQARLLSDEEVENERLELGYYRQGFEKEKQEMLAEIQQLENARKPQQDLRDVFEAERNKLYEELDALHNDIKAAKLNQIDTVVNKQHLEREVLGFELEKTQLQKELDLKSDLVDKLLAEKEVLQTKFANNDLVKDKELTETQQSLSVAHEQVETLSQQVEQLKKIEASSLQVTSLQQKIDSLQAELSQNKASLHEVSLSEKALLDKKEHLSQQHLQDKENYNDLDSRYSQLQQDLAEYTDIENVQRTKLENLESELLNERERHRTLEYDYAKIKSELDSAKTIVEDPAGNNDEIESLTHQIQLLNEKESQFRKVLKDKNDRYDLVVKHYEKIKKENEALRAANKVSASIKSLSPVKNTEEVTVSEETQKASTATTPALDKETSAKLQEGEEILKLAKMFVIEDEKKARGE